MNDNDRKFFKYKPGAVIRDARYKKTVLVINYYIDHWDIRRYTILLERSVVRPTASYIHVNYEAVYE